MPKKYDFKEQLKKGEEAELVLDSFFRGRGWKVYPVEMDLQRAGIDRVFENSMIGQRNVEYKTDWKAGDTHNGFVETVSVGVYDDYGDYHVKKPGWVWTSTADYLMYYVPGYGVLYVFRPDTLRDFMRQNITKYRSVTVRNKGYTGRGRLVPLKELAKVAIQQIKVGPD